MGSESKRVHPRLPAELARAIKIDAARQDMSVQDWIKEASEDKLQKSREQQAKAA